MNTDYTIIYRLLDDIHTSSQRILNLLKNMHNENFIDDSLIEVQDIQDIVARRFTIIGEAAAKLLKNYPEFCQGHPELPLTHIRALRNIIIHEYNEIDWQAVWDISTNELTQLEEIVNVSKQNLVLFNNNQDDTHSEGQNTLIRNDHQTNIDDSRKIKQRSRHR